MSGRQVGIVIEYVFLLSLNLNPKLFRIFLISADEILLPIIFSNLSKLNLICLFLKLLSPEIIILLIFPPHNLLIIFAASFNPYSIMLGSTPLSNLNLASELMPNFFAIFDILTGSNKADSKKIFLVSKEIEELSPPITPPKPRISLSLVIRHASSSSEYLLLSKAKNFSPFLDERTVIFLSTLSASYACRGLFKSSMI